jgi:uncharacterized OB-fold protein
LAEAALADALKDAGHGLDEVAHLIVTGTHARAVATAVRTSGVEAGRVAADHIETLGIAGAAHPGLLLIDVLGRARPGDLIALLVLADGADCLLLRAGDGLSSARPVSPVQGTTLIHPVDYQDFLVWRGMLRREPPRRPDPDRPASPPSWRNVDWKFGFSASRCTACGTRHLPPARVCFNCHAVDEMTSEALASTQGTVRTFSVDHLAFSVAPPVVAAVIDLDGGGRLQCQLTDCDPKVVAVGDRVEMTFRRMYMTADGVHNYFWKARPIVDEEN